MMSSVRHSTASGRLDEGWDWDRREMRIEARLRMGARTAAVSVAVCSERDRRVGAHPIIRIDGETWRILPARYVRAFPNRIETLIAVACPIGDLLEPGEALNLTNTPPAVDAELEAL